ncbi:MAG: isochorismatase family protein [Phycisphaerae bacterium]|nr:isochorismatase family protein [Phycisphaerae bacterium]
MPLNLGAAAEMIRPILTLRKKRILIDVDTQRDLFLAEGNACVRNHRRVLANIRRVMAWTRRDQIRLISTVQCHNPSNGHNGDFCVSGTLGVCKIPYTLRNRRVTFDSSDTTDFPRDVLRNYDQLILCKRTIDPFEEPRAERVLTEVKASEFIVIGGPTESSVLYTVLGLLTRGKSVTVIVDALGSHEKSAADIALRKMQAKGARLTDSKLLFGNSRLQLVNACECERCRGRVHSSAS